jgi:hypothetical protein
MALPHSTSEASVSDRKRILFGFIFLLIALFGAAVVGVGGWVGRDFQTGALLGLGTFALFAALAVYQFAKIRDFAWLPAVAGGVYAILPDIFLGPTDDIWVLIGGAAITGLLSWRKSRKVG